MIKIRGTWINENTIEGIQFEDDEHYNGRATHLIIKTSNYIFKFWDLSWKEQKEFAQKLGINGE